MTEKSPRSERLRLRISGTLSAAVAALALSACESAPSEDRPPQSGVIQDELDKALARLEGRVDIAKCKIVYSSDNDCDGVLNVDDKLPGRADFGDDDGDLVVNVFDKYPGSDDKVDSDGDGLWDCFDGFYGNNFADDDQDGILNGHDIQPNLPQSSTNQDARISAGNLIATTRMGNQAFRDYLAIDPMVAPSLPHPLKTDSDRDGTNDYFDTEPRNPYITPKNDVYNIGGDAWHEKNQERKREQQRQDGY